MRAAMIRVNAEVSRAGALFFTAEPCRCLETPSLRIRMFAQVAQWLAQFGNDGARNGPAADLAKGADVLSWEESR